MVKKNVNEKLAFMENHTRQSVRKNLSYKKRVYLSVFYASLFKFHGFLKIVSLRSLDE